MEARLEYRKFSQDALQAMLALEKYIAHCGLDHKFVHLLKLRASQINGCAFCIDMHSIDARAAGETEQRLYALNAWRETPFFTDRERAGLAWIESVTLVAQTHVPDEVYEEALAHFSEKEIVDLTFVAAGELSPAAITASLRSLLSTRQVPIAKHRFTVLDTFDSRIQRSGARLTRSGVNGAPTMTWQRDAIGAHLAQGEG